jgi:PhoH-like ATPase
MKRKRARRKSVMGKNVFILDTNVLLQNPFSIRQFGADVVAIPAKVMEEVMNHKKAGSWRIREAARKVQNMIRRIVPLRPGDGRRAVRMETGGFLLMIQDYKGRTGTFLDRLERTPDTIILQTARYFQDTHRGSTVVLVSNDKDVYEKARLCGIGAQGYESRACISPSSHA